MLYQRCVGYKCEVEFGPGDSYYDTPCGIFCSSCMKQHVKRCDACARKFPEAITAGFGCPNCKSENVSENNIVQIRLRVTEWDAEGEPADFGYPWKEVDNTIRCVTEKEAPRYYCHGCDHEFETPERIGETPCPG
jgi:hypothetical protein